MSDRVIDFENLWKKCPKGTPHQRVCVMTELQQRAPTTLREFMVSVQTARGANILTSGPQLTADDFTRDEWRRLFESLGANNDKVRRALWELGFGE